MSMKEDCQAAIYSYAPQERQNNAYLYGEHRDYVESVIAFLRDNYRVLKEQGATEWYIEDHIQEAIDTDKPY